MMPKMAFLNLLEKSTYALWVRMHKNVKTKTCLEMGKIE